MTASYPKGSEWRKWDLHVHSPSSYNFRGSWEEFVIQLADSECALIGINDYFSVSGYKELKLRIDCSEEHLDADQNYVEALTRIKSKMFLPIVECRMTNILQNRHGNSGVRINFHIIFSNEIAVDDIETFIKNLSVQSQMIGSRYEDSKFLLEDVSVDFFDTLSRLRSDETFKEKYLIWIPYDEYGGIDEIDPRSDKLLKQGFIKAADLLGSSNQKQADFFLCKSEKFSEKQIEEWIGQQKPCIKGSDSHNSREELGRLKDEKSQPTDKYFWVKADPSFSGLCQIVNEPEDRIFMGAKPPKLEKVENNKTCYISEIKITKKGSSNLTETWFNCRLPLNHGMIAIIGNKGKGKSALTDIIALTGGTSKTEHFSFLSKDRFRFKNGRLASHFEASIKWEDGTETSPISLNENPSKDSLESVVYIPQSYLENICTENDANENSHFQRELRHVIFSHVSDDERLGKSSLDELINYKTEEVQEKLEKYRKRLGDLNEKIVDLENKGKPGFRRSLESQLASKRRELESLDQPKEVENPDDLPEEKRKEYTSFKQLLEDKNSEISSIQEEIDKTTVRRTQIIGKLAVIEKLKGKISNLEEEVNKFKLDNQDSFAEVEVNIDEIVEISFKKDPLYEKERTLKEEKMTVESKLSDESTDESLIYKLGKLNKELQSLEDQLDQPQRLYQEYLRSLNEWEQRKAEIEGEKEKVGTIKFYEAQLEYLDKQLQDDLRQLEDSRTSLARDIYKCIADTRDIYKQLFLPIQKLIENSILIKEGFKLSFGASVIEWSLRRNFFEDYISRGVSGSFCGTAEGEKRLESIVSKYDLDSEDEAIQLAEDLLDQLKTDHRNDSKTKVSIESQLRQGKTAKTVQDLYNYIWSFEYLKPEYFLKLDEKHLSQLSPGERGSLLLVFYLLIDKSKQPIIIDQPEGNLDNYTVYRLLFPVIREVKKERQIIMVTHSPNIAVVCDAEQIIHAEFDRINGNEVIYTSGSIENPKINKHIVDVLEGTRPAFRKRDAKYQVTSIKDEEE